MRTPPRRLDVEDVEPWFAAKMPSLAIFVSGERMTRVLAYDIDDGYVVRIRAHEDGTIMVEDGEVLTEIINGKVAVELREPTHA